jgi:hypothetical protein
MEIYGSKLSTYTGDIVLLALGLDAHNEKYEIEES